MLKKLSLTGLALLLASGAFAQTTTTNFSTPATLTVGNCVATVNTLIYNSATNTVTTDAAGCGGGTPSPLVSLSISPGTYTLGSGAAAPVITWTPNGAATGATCALTPPAGFTATVSGSTFILSTPTTAGTYTFAPTCTNAGAAVTVSPASVSLTVSNGGGGGGGGGTCSATAQPSSSINGKILQRQCSGDVFIQPGPIAGSQGMDQTDLGKVLNGSFPSYSYAGYSPTFSIQSGHYIALAFTPVASGSFQITANPSYGDGGTVAISTVPGAMTQGSAGFVCGVGRSAANGIFVTTAPGNYCSVALGTTYYLNLADVDVAGNLLCYNGRPNSCASSTVSYTIYTGG